MNANAPQRSPIPAAGLAGVFGVLLGLSACGDGGRIAAVTAQVEVQGAPLDAALPKPPAKPSAKAPAKTAQDPVSVEPVTEPLEPGTLATAVEAARPGTQAPTAEPQAPPEPSAEERLRAADFELLEGGTVRATFLDLDFPDYLPPDQREPDEPEILALSDFPERIRLLDDRQVAIDGFMLVANWKDKQIERFMLGRFPPGCCFGAIPVYYEWIDVFPGKELTTDYSPWYPITVTGQLEVGEKTDEDGYVESIYRMTADSVEELE